MFAALLREKLKVKESNLYNEIQEVIDKGLLPTVLLENIDYIRQVGNIAAHTTKSVSTGEIVDVEVGEAEWNLDVLEMIFDTLFVHPEIAKRKKDELNKKLLDAGREPMK